MSQIDDLNQTTLHSACTQDMIRLVLVDMFCALAPISSTSCRFDGLCFWVRSKAKMIHATRCSFDVHQYRPPSYISALISHIVPENNIPGEVVQAREISSTVSRVSFAFLLLMMHLNPGCGWVAGSFKRVTYSVQKFS
jgi:hypothetical protein